MAPLNIVDSGQIIAAFLLTSSNNKVPDEILTNMQLNFKLLSQLEKSYAKQSKEDKLKQLLHAMLTLTAVNKENNFKGAAMALCNEVASQWGCERVSVGFLKGKYIKVRAMSHTENFVEKMQLVQDIESAMEECFDQDIEIVYPAQEDATYITRAAEALSKHYGPLSTLSLPLRKADKIQAVLTLERPADKPFNIDQIETIRLASDLCSARLIDLYENKSWVPTLFGYKGRNLISKILSPQHTLAKILAIAVFLGLVFVIFVKGTFKTQSSFVIEATFQQVIPAAFDGYLKTVGVEVGDIVEADKTILGTLDTVDLRLQLAQTIADKVAYQKQSAAAMRDGKTAEAQIAQASADKAEAQIGLLNYHLEQANLKSPITGTVIKGDLKKQIGAPVKTGDVLFEVTPVETLRAQLMVPEDQIVDIKVGQKGYLATYSYPGQYVGFEVELINPVAEVINQRNIFKVRARLLDTYPWMRPGMEGVAKVHIEKRPFISIWTRKIVNWIRMKLWI
jgi:multidrug resistance efflux pump